MNEKDKSKLRCYSELFDAVVRMSDEAWEASQQAIAKAAAAAGKGAASK
jgi:hypothetical protein